MSININKRSVGLILLGITFFLSMVLPTTYQPIKAVTFFTGLLLLFNDRLLVAPPVLFWIVLMIVCDIFFQIRGVINDGDGALRVSTVTILWPTCYIFIMSALHKVEYFSKICRLIVFATWVIVIYTIILICSAYWNIPIGFLSIIDCGFDVGFYDHFIEYTTYNMATLIFTLPFIFSMWLTKLYEDFFSKKTYIILCLLLLMLAIVSGRTIFQINLIFILLLNIWLGWKILDDKKKIIKFCLDTSLCCFVALFVVVLFYEVSISAIIGDIADKFNFNSTHDTSGGIRGQQFNELIRYWKEKPLLGWGLGVGVKTSVRSVEQNWAYELTYVARLFQTGIVGFVLYMSYIGWIIYKSILIIKRKTSVSKIMYSTLIAFICFMIANATNPYLTKFDFMWVVFLPLALINFDYLERSKFNNNSQFIA
jgi:O-antigen ligase